MQHTTESEIFDVRYIFILDAFRKKNILFVVDLPIDIIAYPILIGQVENAGLNWFYFSKTIRIEMLDHVPQCGGLLLLPIDLAIPSGRNEYIIY